MTAGTRILNKAKAGFTLVELLIVVIILAILAAIVVVLVAIGSGVVLLALGSRPADGLHLLYAAVAVLVLPAVRFPAAFARRRGLAVGVGALVLVALVVRLAQTG